MLDRVRSGRSVRLLVTLVLVGMLARLVDVRQVARVLLSVDPLLFGAAIGIAAADRALMIGKWYPLLRAQAPSITLWQATRAYLASGFASVLLPASVGGDVLRAVALGRGRNRVSEIGASIAAERLLGLIGLGILTVVAVVVALEDTVSLAFLLPWAAGSLIFTALAAWLPLSAWGNARVQRWLQSPPKYPRLQVVRRFAAAYVLYRRHPRTLLVVGVLSFLEQSLPILQFWLLGYALSTSIDLRMLIVAVPLTLFIARVPITLGGLGMIEGAMVYLLGLFGVPPIEALAVALAGRVAELVAVTPGAFLWSELLGKRSHTRPAVLGSSAAPAPGAEAHT